MRRIKRLLCATESHGQSESDSAYNAMNQSYLIQESPEFLYRLWRRTMLASSRSLMSWGAKKQAVQCIQTFGIDFTILHSSTHLLISWLCIAALGSSRQHSASVEQKDLKHHKDTTRRAARIWCCTRKVVLVVLIVFSWHVLPQIPQIASVSTCSPVLLLRRFWNNLMPLHDELMSSPHLKTSVPYGLMFVNHLMLAEMELSFLGFLYQVWWGK